MKEPCEQCRERDICTKKGMDACQRLEAFKKYKIKCQEISTRTVEIMANARRKAEEEKSND